MVNGASKDADADVVVPEGTWIAPEETLGHQGEGARMSTEVRHLDVRLTRTSLRIVEMREPVGPRRLFDALIRRADRGHGPKALVNAATEKQCRDQDRDHGP